MAKQTNPLFFHLPPSINRHTIAHCEHSVVVNQALVVAVYQMHAVAQ